MHQLTTRLLQAIIWFFAVAAASANAATVSVTPTSVPAGTSITTAWSGISSPASQDWVGIYPAGAADNAFQIWRYTNGAAGGSLALPSPTTAGTYEVRLFSNNSFVRLASGNSFAVNTPAVSLGVSPATVAVNGTTSASWSGIASPSTTDWIGLYAPGAADSAFKGWRYTTGVTAGAVPFPLPAAGSAGTYEMRLFSKNGYTRLATSNALTVTGAAVAPDTQSPSVPSGLTGTALSSTQVKLTWNASTDNVGVTGYYVYLNDAPLTTTTATTFTHSGLTAGTTYRYRVSAFDAVPNHSAWTATPVAVTPTGAAAAPDTQAPSVPAGLTGTALSATQIKLTWNASTDNKGVTGYYVYLNDAQLTTTTATTFTHSGLTAGTTYRYRVSAFDAVPNHSAWTATPVAVTTPGGADTQAPSVPTGLTGTALSSTQVKLTWNASTDNVGVTGYYVYLNDTQLGTTTSTTYTHSGLTAGTTYNYRVSAFDAVPNHSAWTASAVAVTTSGGSTGGTGGGTTTGKFIPTFLVYYGGGPVLTSADTAKLAKFDLIDFDRFRYNNINGNTWSAIKAVNPNIQIYVYQDGTEVNNTSDSTQQQFLNNVGRYNVSRGHPMGTLNGNNSGLFLLDSSGNRIYNQWFSNPGAGSYYYLLDFGSASYQSYWVQSVKADIADQPWKADGIFTDLCMTFPAAAGHNALPAKYPSNAAWSSAMNNFTAGISAGVRGFGQKLWCNKGDSRYTDGAAAWRALDASSTPPDVLMEEGAFAVAWGAAVQFFPETDWKSQVDTMAAMTKVKVTMLSHTQLAPGASGTDNYGRTVTYWQALWYSLGSFLLGKNDVLNNAYFMFNGAGEYTKIWWHDEYDRIDLGRAIGGYKVTNIGGNNVYWREFERGYVYVNPTANNVASIGLPAALRRLTHDTLATAVTSLPLVTTLALNSHEAAILLK